MGYTRPPEVSAGLGASSTYDESMWNTYIKDNFESVVGGVSGLGMHQTQTGGFAGSDPLDPEWEAQAYIEINDGTGSPNLDYSSPPGDWATRSNFAIILPRVNAWYRIDLWHEIKVATGSTVPSSLKGFGIEAVLQARNVSTGGVARLEVVGWSGGESRNYAQSKSLSNTFYAPDPTAYPLNMPVGSTIEITIGASGYSNPPSFNTLINYNGRGRTTLKLITT